MPTTILDGETYEQARHRRFTEEAKVIEKMQQDEIIRMAREAGGVIYEVDWCFEIENLERFAALVAAHERNRHAWTQEHWTEYEHAIAAAEREACAKFVDHILKEGGGTYGDAIRARSKLRGEENV